jgi:hypothetical protein
VKIPLVIRLLALLTLAWRLIIMAKKENPVELKPSFSLLDLPKAEPLKLNKSQRTFEGTKALYRNNIRGYETDNQTNMLIYLFVLVSKEVKKAGIFRFIWYKPEYTLAFYQSLSLIAYTEPKLAFEKILNKINSPAFTSYTEQNVLPKTEDFIVEGNTDRALFEAFDAVFKSEIYLKNILLHASKA